MSIDFDILPSDPVPIYRQIVDQVRRRVASGSLAAGHELPSVRALAQAHAINPMTVSKAYSLLETEGLLERRRGMGMFVAAVRTARSASQRLALLEPALQAAAQQASELGLGAGQALQLFERCLARAGLPGGPVEEEP
jgi:GntR family transcriptional regulator